MTVIIGIDPHKATHTAVAIGCDEGELATVTVRATRQQVDKLLGWATSFEGRTWAIESAGGLGYLLAQQLVDAGEHVLDVPATLASRVRVLGTGKSDKNDPNDARSVAIAALRSPGLRSVQRADHSEVLRLLAKRNQDIGDLRTKLVCRLHALIACLAAGGIAKELNASDADGLLGTFEPCSPVEATRHQLALELLEDIRRLDSQLKESHKRMKIAVRASGTSLIEVFGIGPVLACALIGYTGTSPDSRAETSLPLTTALPPSRSPLVVGRPTGCPDEGTVSSTTPSTWWPSVRSARRTRRAVATSRRRWPKARPRGKQSAHSSGRSPTQSSGIWSSTPSDKGSGRTSGNDSWPA
jgi:transposase